MTQNLRMKQFEESIRYGLMFTCVCCMRKCTKHGVQTIPENFETILKQKHPEKCDLFNEAIGVVNIPKVLDSHYLCTTCYKHLQNGKFPTLSHKNNLRVYDHDIYPELNLTELENALIAKNIIFQKYLLLPRSRHRAIKGQIVNVPIYDIDVTNTISQFPRNPESAEIVPVNFKRKLSYNHAYMRQYINSNRVYQALETIKKMNNPFYTNVILKPREIFDEEFLTKIMPDDNIEDNSDDDSDYKPSDESSDSNDSYDDCFSAEEYYSEDSETFEDNEDAVKKFQFDYGHSTVMANDCPEINVKDTHLKVCV